MSAYFDELSIPCPNCQADRGVPCGSDCQPVFLEKEENINNLSVLIGCGWEGPEEFGEMSRIKRCRFCDVASRLDDWYRLGKCPKCGLEDVPLTEEEQCRKASE